MTAPVNIPCECRVCGKVFYKYAKPRKGRGGCKYGFIRPFHTVTCSTYCSKENQRILTNIWHKENTQ